MSDAAPADLCHPERTQVEFALERDFARRLLSSAPVEQALKVFRAGPAMLPARVAALGPTRVLLGLVYVAMERAVRAAAAPYAMGTIVDDHAVTELLVALDAFPEGGDFVLSLRDEAWFDRAGRHIYELSPRLATRLADAAFEDLTTDSLQLPFESIYLVVPAEAGLTLTRAGDGTRWPLVGCYVTEVTGAADLGMRSWSCAFVARVEDRAAMVHHFAALLPRGERIETVLRTQEQLIRAKGLAKAAFDSAQHEEKRALFSFVLHAVTWATWPDARHDERLLNREYRALRDRIAKAAPGSPKRSALQAQLRGLDPRRRIYLGAELPPDEPPRASAGAPLAHFVRVQGHWKLQPHGPRNSERKRIFVHPYWRGPEDVGPAPAGRHVLDAS